MLAVPIPSYGYLYEVCHFSGDPFLGPQKTTVGPEGWDTWIVINKCGKISQFEPYSMTTYCDI